MAKNDTPLLKIEDLVLHFKVGKTGVVRAVDGVNFNLGFKEAVVVLGESGCGKTSLAKAILRLLPKNIERYSGKVILNGVDTMALDDEAYRKDVRWVKMSMVPQAAMNSLNPVMKVGEQVAEPVMVHSGASKEDALQTGTQNVRPCGCSGPIYRPVCVRAKRRDAPALGDRHGIGNRARPDHS